MTESPENEVKFRTEEREGGTRHENDNNYEDANETIEEPREGIHVHGEGDTRDRMRGVNGQGMIRGAPNGRFHDDHRYKMSIKPESYDGVEDWEEYISHFEIYAELGKWRETD